MSGCEPVIGLSAKAESALITFAAGFPQAWEDHPCEHTVFKVGKKVFVFFGGAAGPPGELSMTVKLPISFEMALTLPYVSPAGHGLGRAGWAHVRQADAEEIDLDTLKGWIAQSYRAVAPKKLVKLLDGQPCRTTDELAGGAHARPEPEANTP